MSRLSTLQSYHVPESPLLHGQESKADIMSDGTSQRISASANRLHCRDDVAIDQSRPSLGDRGLKKGKQVLPTRMPQLTIDWRSFARWNSGGSTTRRHMILVFIGLVTITTIVALATALAQ